MSGTVYDYSTTPGSNNAAPPFGWPEGMQRKDVNDTARQHYAEVKAMLEAFPWMNFAVNKTLTRTSATRLTITGVDLTAVYPARRRVRILGTSPATAYGTIYASTFSAGNTLLDIYFEGDVGVPTSPTQVTAEMSEVRSPAGWLFLREQLPSAAAQVDITDVINSDFERYRICIDDLLVATNAQDLYMRASANNGSSFDATGNYYWTVGLNTDFPAGGDLGLAAQNQINLIGGSANFRLASASPNTLNGYIEIQNRGTASLRMHYLGHFTYTSDGGFNCQVTVAGHWRGAGPMNALRLLSSSGNITRGRIRTFGLKGTLS